MSEKQIDFSNFNDKEISKLANYPYLLREALDSNKIANPDGLTTMQVLELMIAEYKKRKFGK